MDSIINVPYSEVDHMVAHQFFSAHTDEIGRDLLRSRGASSRRGRVAPSQAKPAWDELCSVLVDLGPLPKYPSLVPLAGMDHSGYVQFYLHNASRDTRKVKHLFHKVDPVPGSTFFTYLFHLNQVDVEVMDHVVLLVHILSVSFIEDSS